MNYTLWENYRNTREFLERNTRNKNKIAVTSDIDDKYKLIIEDLGFKHQWCYFHALKNFNKIIKKILSKINGYSKVIQLIICNSFMPYFKTFFASIEDGNIERTSNKLENKFQKTFPKSIKSIMKIKKGAMSRINIRKEILNQIKVFDTQPSSFWQSHRYA